MIPQNFKYIKYPTERDILFVFGAGASQADGVPLQKDILPLILNDETIAKSEIGRVVIKFIKDNFAYDTKTNNYPHLESVFLFIDYFIQQNESLNKYYTNNLIQKIKEYLIKLIYFIVNKETTIAHSTYFKFWEKVKNNNTNISIITLNYDTLLEQAFEPMFKKVGYLDYSFPLMNYENTTELKYFNFWINPRELVIKGENRTPVAFKIIKLHGSLNWKYCNCCNQTLLTPWEREMDLNKGKLTWYSKKEKKRFEYVCPVDGTAFQTLILTPSFSKNLSMNVISQLLGEAGREIRAAKKIVFIGYSFSNADMHIRALFKKHIQHETEVLVLNSKMTESLKLKYKSISQNVKFYNTSFQDCVKSNNLTAEIFGD